MNYFFPDLELLTVDADEDGHFLISSLMKSMISSFIALRLGLVQSGLRFPSSSSRGPYFSTE